VTKVPLVDHDQSDLSHQIATELKTIAGLEIEDTFLQDGMPHAMTEGLARQQLDARRRAITLLIPQGFSESVMAGRPTAFILLQNPGEQLTLGIVRGLLTSFADRLSLQITAARAALMPSQGQANPEETVQHALRGSRELWETPAIGVRVQDATGMAGRDINVFQQNVPGYAVMFTMMGGGKALLEERELGTLRRLRTAPVSKASILVGKLVTNFFTAFMEVVVFFAFGHVVFGIKLGNSLLGLAMLASAVALAATSLGICIAALVKTQAQLSYASVLTV
jgi:ABC-2 type transport system permease protein